MFYKNKGNLICLLVVFLVALCATLLVDHLNNRQYHYIVWVDSHTLSGTTEQAVMDVYRTYPIRGVESLKSIEKAIYTNEDNNPVVNKFITNSQYISIENFIYLGRRNK